MDRQTCRWHDIGAPRVMNSIYVGTTRLMLRVIPLVFSIRVLAMKGGTAINLFLTNMPRLSVDIDVVFLPMGLTRDEALSAIATELRRLRAELQNMGLIVREAPSADFLESQLLINDGSLQVRVEVNTVFRGALMNVGTHQLHPNVSKMFTTDTNRHCISSQLYEQGRSPRVLQTGTGLEFAAIRERPVSTSPAVETPQSPPPKEEPTRGI